MKTHCFLIKQQTSFFFNTHCYSVGWLSHIFCAINAQAMASLHSIIYIIATLKTLF